MTHEVTLEFKSEMSKQNFLTAFEEIQEAIITDHVGQTYEDCAIRIGDLVSDATIKGQGEL